MHYTGIFLPKGMNLVDYMDEQGIDVAVVNTLNTKANLGDVMKLGPEMIAAAVQDDGFELFQEFRLAGQPDNGPVQALAKQHPDRVIPFFWYNPADPDDPDQKRGLSTLDSALAHGFKGVKIQPSMTAMGIEQLFPVAGLLSELNLPLYIHPNAGLFAARKTEAFDLAILAKTFPRLPIILGHAAYTMEFCIEATFRLVRFPNVHVETSQSIPYGIITLAKLFGPSRVIFGSDAPSATPFGLEYQKLALLQLPVTAKQQVLAGNIERLVADSRA